MSASAQPNARPDPDLQIPMPVLVKFVRQLGHDLRNQLNAAELQSAYLAEVVPDGELTDEIKRLRAMISQIGASLERLTSSFGSIKLTVIPYGAADLMDDLRQKLTADHSNESAKIDWDVQVGDATLQIDPQLLPTALIELFANAFRHERTQENILVEAKIEGNRFRFTMREPKKKFEHSTEKWGLEPLQTVGRGHYGLGLHRARAIIEAHGGQLDARYDSSAAALITTVSLPLAKPGD